MKKNIIMLSFVLLTSCVFAQTTQQEALDKLKNKHYMLGCTPVNFSLKEPLRGGFNYAAFNNEVEIMELEKRAGLDITTCGEGLPYNLIMHKSYKALDFLFKNGYDVNKIYLDHSYLTFAIYRKNADAVKVLIDNGVDVNLIAKGKHPLHSAIKKNNFDIVELLVNAGAKSDDKTLKLANKAKDKRIKNLFENN